LKQQKKHKSKKLTKAQAERVHAKKRAKERYNLDLNRFDLREIIQQISLKQAKLLENKTNRLALYQIDVKGISCKVIYDRQRKQIVTFLRPTMN
jgi:hypothetical protein